MSSRTSTGPGNVLSAVAETQARITEAGADVDAVLNLVAEQARLSTGAAGAVVEMREEDEMVYRAAVGTVAPHVGLRLRVDSSLSGTVAQSGEAVVCRDSEADPRVDREAARAVNARSMLLLPLHDRGRTVGVLKVLSPEVDAFGERELEVMRLLAGLMSTSIAVATASRQKEELNGRLRAIFDAATDAIYSTDTSDRITMWGPSSERLLLWKAEEVLGEPLPLVPAEQRPEMMARLSEVKEGRPLRGWETVHQTKDGEEIEVRLSAAPILEESGDVSGIAFFASDIRQEKRLQEQLQRSQKLETIGRLAGGIAHDFNNMLTAIAGFSRLLLDDPALGPEQSESVEEILGAAKRSAYITQQLLAYSRRQVLTPRSLDLNTILEGMHGLVDQLLGKGIDVEIILAPNAWPIRADRGQLEQVILNLLVNAREAMGTTPGRVTVSTENVTVTAVEADTLAVEPGMFVRLVVEDTGPGIPPEVLEHIFEPFYTTKHLTEGTGLGLATVEGVVRQSGGGIRVDSELGEGTRFEIYLPRDTAEAGSIAAGGDDPDEIDTARILVVEDEAPVRKLVCKILSRAGHEVVDAATPSRALRLLADQPDGFDLVVSDVVMPEMSGFTLWEKARESVPDLPFLFVSGYIEEELEEVTPGERSGFLSKPFSPDELLAAIQRLMQRARPSRP